MKSVKKLPYKLVQVSWVDISSDSSWRALDEVLKENLPRCLSTGYLVSEKDDVIRLVSDFIFNDDGTIYECGSSTLIPKSVVQEIKEVL